MGERVAIVGSRDWPRGWEVTLYVRHLPEGTVVVTGGARGVDKTAEREAKRCGLKCEVYVADWDTYGKRAGFLRNQEIVDACDRVVAFWDGQSKGTGHTINLARQAGKPVEVIKP